MLVSCILCSHNKPEFCSEAIESVITQTHQDWQLIVMDSGTLADQGYFDRWLQFDTRIKVYKTGETEATRRKFAMAPWTFNEALRRGLVKGELIVFLCDDDVLLPPAFSAYVNYAVAHPDHEAWYSSQQLERIYSDGRREYYGERRAFHLAGRCVQGMTLSCVVDYLQLCIRSSVLRFFKPGLLWDEQLGYCDGHKDGLLLEAIGSHTPIYPLDVKCSVNRRTHLSTYGPTY